MIRIALLLLLTGCSSLTPRQQTVVKVAVSVAVVGAIAIASQDSDRSRVGLNPPDCARYPESCR